MTRDFLLEDRSKGQREEVHFFKLWTNELSTQNPIFSENIFSNEVAIKILSHEGTLEDIGTSIYTTWENG